MSPFADAKGMVRIVYHQRTYALTMRILGLECWVLSSCYFLYALATCIPQVTPVESSPLPVTGSLCAQTDLNTYSKTLCHPLRWLLFYCLQVDNQLLQDDYQFLTGDKIRRVRKWEQQRLLEIIGIDEKSVGSQMGKPVPQVRKNLCRSRHPGNRKIVQVLTLPIIDIIGRVKHQNVETPTETSNCNGCSRRSEAKHWQQDSTKAWTETQTAKAIQNWIKTRQFRHDLSRYSFESRWHCNPA